MLGNTTASRWALATPPAPKVTNVWRVVAKNAGGSTPGPNWTFEVDPIAGDANGDGVVNSTDFATLLNHYNQPGGWGAGDFDGDGQVGFGDFQILELNFGSTAPVGITEPVLAGLKADKRPVFSVTPVKPVKVAAAPVRRR